MASKSALKAHYVAMAAPFMRTSVDASCLSPSDPGVPVDRDEPEREPAVHHSHHPADHPLLQWHCPAQLRALSGMYI